MRWSGATGAIARCKRVSTGCGRKRRSVPAWPWICGVKPKPKAVNKPSPHSIVHGLDKPGVFTTVSTLFHIPWLRLWVRKGDWEIVQPGNRGTRLIKSSFAQDRIVSPFVKMHHNPVGLHFELSPSFHKLAIELFGFRFVKAMQLRGQPPVAPMGKHRQGHVHIDVEPHLTGQTVEVKEIDADAEAILDAIAAGVAGNEVPGTGVEVVGHKEGRLGMPQAVHGHLPYGASISSTWIV